jgi:eukaryotic-like serine/threonine-protein kinase
LNDTDDKADEFQPPPFPKAIGPYKIESLLEKGGMSVLYLGTHPDTKDPVTIKVLSSKYLANADVVQRFLNEAQIIALADHPNIVKLFGYGEWAGGLYIAMEFIQGISLRQYLLQTPVSLKKSLEIIIDAAYALCHLHTHGIIHRDLKPENILMTEKGTIKVIDFGISQLLTEKKEPSTPWKKHFVGTPIYMSPEQKENPETVSYPSDIYSLGIIAYELVLGKLSHGQVHISLMPKGFQKILNKALQYKPQDRYQDIVDFISDVTAYLHSSTLQKEQKVGDQLSELSEDFKQAQGLLIPVSAPQWPQIDVGIVTNKSLSFPSYYYDFFSVYDGYGICLGESLAKGAEGVLRTASLRGMVRVLCHLAAGPAELARALNKSLSQDFIEQEFHLSYLMLSPKRHQLHFLSCGCYQLWYLASENVPVKILTDNPPLGSDSQALFEEVTQPWEEGCLLLLSTLSPTMLLEDNDLIENIYKETLLDNVNGRPQKIVELIQRKIRLSPALHLREHLFTLICIQCKNLEFGQNSPP